jgi:hypothetical protein
MIIKSLLLLSLLVAALLAYRSPLSSRNAALRRLFAMALLVFGGIAVFNPPLVTGLARQVGVGRGTDLLVYFLAVASLLGWLSLWRRIFELEQRLVLLTRSNALHDAQHRLATGEHVHDSAPSETR